MKNKEKIKQPACGLHCIKIKQFSVSIGQNQILQNVNLHIHCGKLTAIIGRNGAGKSTFIKAILGEIPHEGEIAFKQITSNEKAELKIGYVPQNFPVDLYMPVSVYDLLACSISKAPIFLGERKKIKERILQQLHYFAAEDLLNRKIGSLSGGELQRVLLSLATLPVPNLLLLDEAVSGMDQKGIQLFYEILDQLKKQFDLAIILVSHDLEYVAKYADEVILLDKTVQEKGRPDQVYQTKIFRETFGNPYFSDLEFEKRKEEVR